MKKKLFMLIHIIFLISSLTSCQSSGDKKADAESLSAAKNPVVVVVQPVSRQNIAQKILTKGTFQADEKAIISPKTSARIMEIMVEEGDRVGKGQILVRVDDTQLNLDVKRAEASVEELKARVDAAETDVENAGARLAAVHAAVNRSQADLNLKLLEKERIERLVQQGSLPQQKYDYAKNAYDIAQASLEASQAEVESARSGLRAAEAGLKTMRASLRSGEKMLDISRERLQDTKITAPFVGVISRRNMNRGEIAEPGKPVLILEKTDLLELRARVSSEYLQQIKPGLEVIIHADGFSGQREAVITRVNPSIDPVDRSIEIICEIPNKDEFLKPGLFAKLEIIAQVFQDMVIIPNFSIVERNNQKVVFIAEHEQSKMVPVVTGYEAEEKTVILQGLQGSELLIIEGQNELSGNEALRIAEKG